MPLVLVAGNKIVLGTFIVSNTVINFLQFKITIILISKKIRPYIYFWISVNKYMFKVIIKNMCTLQKQSLADVLQNIDFKNFADFTGNSLSWSLFSINICSKLLSKTWEHYWTFHTLHYRPIGSPMTINWYA